MDSTKVASVFCFSLFLSVCAYEIPNVKIEVFQPKGFKASIPSDPAISLFVFQGRINRAIVQNEVGTLSGEVIKPTNGYWVYDNPSIELKIGDVINYYVVVVAGGQGKVKDKLSFTVTEYTKASNSENKPSPNIPTPTSCERTETRIRGGSACAGQTIFEDNFDTLREDIWQIQQFIPVNHPEYPFVSYQRLSSDPTVSVVNGNLRIAPKLQQNLEGYNNESIVTGSLDLFNSCTGSANECFTQASGASILPPIVSGRVVNKGFAFTYGTVYIRAKLPKGDWIYPEILLEPFLKKYDMSFASGVVKIASARGNADVTYGFTNLGNKVLYGGPIMDFQCREHLRSEKTLFNGRMWGDDFHVYSVKWTPERITLSVDDEEWARIEPKTGSLHEHFPSHCRDIPHSLLAAGSKMAPFDDHFYLTLGVAAGGITDFIDGTVSNGYPKPWSNTARKAMLNFWKDLDNWYKTWSNPELLVDYVRVVAL